jgi:ABC-type Mn2+/Zn2+ transport system ATPase subunit
VGQQQFASLLQHLHDDLKLTVMVVSHDIRTVASGCDRVACLSRTLHFHAAPQGLTPAVLAEVFRHDVAAIFGDIHVDAHSASACSDPSHHHAPSAPHAPVTLRVEKPAR